MEMIALHNIATREKAGGPRIVIPAGSRFDTAAYPMVSEAEWQAMMSGTPQVIRTPDDPAFVRPAGTMDPVAEGRSPRTDLAVQAAAVAARDEEEEDPDPTLVTSEIRSTRRRRPRPVADDDEDDNV